jgi:hypothetical protein
MDEFLKYFDDDRFVSWVKNPDSALDKYWEDYFQSFPDEREYANKARLLISQLQSQSEDDNVELAEAIYSGITEAVDRKNTFRMRGRALLTFLRYAAVIVLSVLFGGILVYMHYERQNMAIYNSVEEMHGQEEARLILSDGKVLILDQKESNIEHESDGRIIINGKDTLSGVPDVSGDDMIQLVMPYGRNTSIRLPDGTVAYLNAGSRLVYPSQFSGRTREVYLIGEGYFTVAHNPRMPFVVKTNSLNIMALGTVFNVCAYPSDGFIETVLIEGKVVLRENTSKLLKRDIEVSRGEAVSFNRETLETSARKVDVNDYVTWHLGYLNFHSTDLNRVVSRLERYYNIKIYLDNPMLGIRRISGKLELGNDRLQVLAVLASTAQMELFTINENTYGLK